MITEVRRQFGVRRESGSEDVHLQRRKEADPTPRGTSRRRTEHGSLGMNQHLYGYTHNSFARRVQVLKRRYRRMVFCCRPQGDDVKDLARISFNPPLPAVRTEFARWLRTSRAPRWKGLPSPRARACSQSTLSFRPATSTATTP